MKYFIIDYLEQGIKNVHKLEAETKKEAINKVKSIYKGAIILKTVETDLPISVKITSYFEDFQKHRSSISIDDKIAAFRQIAVMTDAGISIYDSILEVSNFSDNPQLKSIYLNIANDINSGKTIMDAMKVYEKEFGNITIGMTNLGEKTGNISGSYHKLADILENSRDNKKAFKKAIRGPIITLIIMALGFAIIITTVVPEFKKIFEKFDTALPIPTQILLALENALSNYGLLILGIIVGIVFYIMYLYKNSSSAKYTIDKILISPKTFLINKIIYLSSMYQYLLVLSELVSSGIPLSEALDISIKIVDNAIIKEKLLTINHNLARGMNLSEALIKTGLFQNMLLQMIRAGENSGQLDTMLLKIVQFYEREFSELIDNISTYIEPILLICIAVLIIILALGIFMPMWELGSTVNS